jgi:hypothetical protein
MGSRLRSAEGCGSGSSSDIDKHMCTDAFRSIRVQPASLQRLRCIHNSGTQVPHSINGLCSHKHC